MYSYQMKLLQATYSKYNIILIFKYTKTYSIDIQALADKEDDRRVQLSFIRVWHALALIMMSVSEQLLPLCDTRANC